MIKTAQDSVSRMILQSPILSEFLSISIRFDAREMNRENLDGWVPDKMLGVQKYLLNTF